MTDTDLMSDEAEAYLRARHRRTKAHQFDEGISCECMRGIGHSGLMGRVLSGGLGAGPEARPSGSPGRCGVPSAMVAVGGTGAARSAVARSGRREVPRGPGFPPGFVFLEG